jgi:hypothetical protein
MSPVPPRIECVDEDMAAVLRQKSPAERLEIAAGLWRFARDLIQRLLREEHPDWTDAQINAEVARRLSHGAV